MAVFPEGKLRLWRKSLLLCAVLSSAVLILNLSLIGWMGSLDTTEEGSYIGMRGNCKNVNRASLLAHLGINILSTLILGTSNYCMQICIAPTRHDVDRAHSKGETLDIGVPSVRNIGSVSLWRRVLWVVLCFSSLPLHLFYNSIVFTSTVATEYLVSEFDEAFLATGQETRLEGITYSRAIDVGGNPEIDMESLETTFQRILERAPDWDNLTSSDCATLYYETMMTTHRSLVLVVAPSPNVTHLPGLWRLASSYTWMCDDNGQIYLDGNDVSGKSLNLCKPSKAVFGYRDDYWEDIGQTNYCLAEPFEEDCKLELSKILLIIVSVANAIKVVAMLALFFLVEIPSIITIGDAIASFLEHKDISTRDLSAQSYVYFQRRNKWLTSERLTRIWVRHKHRRSDSISFPRSIISFFLFFLAIAVAIVLLSMAIRADSARGTPLFSSLLAKNYFAIIGFESLASATLVDIILLVNTPQLIISILYFIMNSLLTSYLQAAEFNRYSLSPAPLRVSKPEGKQKSTYWLSLPPKYGVVMLLFSATLHWLISQAIFLSKIEFQDFNGGPSWRFGALGYGNMYGDHPGKLLSASYSSLGILLSLMLGASGVIIVFLVGRMKLKGDMILAGSCSAVIAASCYGNIEGDEQKFWTEEVMWGEIASSSNAVHRLGFSSSYVQRPREGVAYL